MNIAQIYFDVHMGLQFKGLADILRRGRIDARNSYVVFINKKRTKFKVLLNDKYLVYHDNKGRVIDVNSIRHLPRAFEGDTFNFNRAVEGLIREKFNDDGTTRS